MPGHLYAAWRNSAVHSTALSPHHHCSVRYCPHLSPLFVQAHVLALQVPLSEDNCTT